MKYIIKYLKLPLRTKLILMEAYVLLGFSRLIIWKLKFKRIAGILGKINQETEFSNEGIDVYKVKQVAMAIKIISKHTFWENKCLVQVFTAKLMLNKRKQKSTVYLGVAKDESQCMIAHAWLRSGRIYVTGGDGSIKFTITSKFV